MTKEEAKNKIAELVTKYKQLSLSGIQSYHEAKTKQGFVLPLFQYLGWDIFNTDEVAPEEKAPCPDSHSSKFSLASGARYQS